MDEFKLALFKKQYNKDFPYIDTLTTQECQRLFNSIISKFNINISNFEADITSKQIELGNSNAGYNFELINTLKKIGIEPRKKVFLNWYRFEKVDCLNIQDLDQYFEDVWFPSADDIDLFDDSFNWIMSITHYGAIRILTNDRI